MKDTADQNISFRCIEWLNVLVSVWWVYLFTLPGSLFKTNPAFNGLAHHAPEWQWSVTILFAIALQAAALLRPLPLLRLFACTAQSGIWAGVATCFALSAPIICYTPVNTAVGVYAAIAFQNIVMAQKIGYPAIVSIRGLLARLSQKPLSTNHGKGIFSILWTALRGRF